LIGFVIYEMNNLVGVVAKQDHTLSTRLGHLY